MVIFYLFNIICIIKLYYNQKCSEVKNCYQCYNTNLCFWCNNECIDLSLYTKNCTNNNVSQYPFLISHYKCIENEKDIILLKEINNQSISIYQQDNNNKEINYNIYCFIYKFINNIHITLSFNNNYKDNIKNVSFYNNFEKNELSVNNTNNNKDFYFRSNNVCLKLTYLSSKIKLLNESLNEEEELLKVKIMTKDINNSFLDNNIKLHYFYSYLFIGIIFVLLVVIFLIFLFCFDREKGNIKNLKILQNNNNLIKELKEKYSKLEESSFIGVVGVNKQTLNSFVQNITDLQKKNAYLKAIIKTLPSFVVGENNKDLQGNLCCFCEKKIKNKERVSLLNCGHFFHYDCIHEQIITNEEFKCIICKELIVI